MGYFPVCPVHADIIPYRPVWLGHVVLLEQICSSLSMRETKRLQLKGPTNAIAPVAPFPIPLHKHGSLGLFKPANVPRSLPPD